MLSKIMKTVVVLLCMFALVAPTSAQSAPSEAGIPPFPGAPLCPTHDNTKWHGLWDSERGCHYDHTHNDDPSVANSIFGPAGAAWGQNISYPWMTANENSGMGHGGYKYYVNVNPKPACSFEGYEYLGVNSLNCVSAFRIMYHDAGGNAHMVKRFHSYYMEVQIKRGNTVGYIKTGGWADFGCLHSSYKKGFLPLPGIDPVQANGQTQCGPGGQGLDPDPYRAFGDTWAEVQGQKSGDNWSIWTAHNRYGYNRMGFFFFRTMDNWGSIDPASPYTEHLLCPDGSCIYNNSEHHVFNVFMMIPSSLDTDRDGIVNYKGYTDRQGNIVQGCTAPGFDCVPLEIVNAPVGNAIWSRNLSGIRTDGDPPHESDIYFNGKPSGWIQFGSMGNMPTNTPDPMGTSMPMPTNTPDPMGTMMPSSTPVPSATHDPSMPFVSTDVNPTNLGIGGAGLVSVKLNNIPAEGFKSAEFICSHTAGLLEHNNIVPAALFGADAAVAIHDPHNGTFIVAMAGTNGNKAATSGPAFTFDITGLQVGQSPIQCTARVSKGDHLAIDLPSTGSSVMVMGMDSSPTPMSSPTLDDHNNPQTTSTAMPPASPTAMPPTDGSLSGQVIAGKPATVSLYDANNVVVQSVAANPDGTFILTAPAGNYTVVASANGFLGHQGLVSLTAGNTTVKPAVTLLAGDIDGNNVIDQFDALTIGMSYATSAPGAADLNNDGVIDFIDLELLAENYRKTGPSVWQ